MEKDIQEKLVIFDWGGVVESHFEDEYDHMKAKIDVINFLNPETKLWNVNDIKEKWNSCEYDENGICISEICDDEDIQKWFEQLKSTFNFNCTYTEFYNLYQEKSDNIIYYKDVVNFAHSLKGKCKIGILSNLAEIDKERIDKHYNLSKFDYVWLSYKLKVRKPKELIYEIVESECNIKPSNILFIDDAIENIEVAKNRGWNVCLATARDFEKIKNTVKEFLELSKEP